MLVLRRRECEITWPGPWGPVDSTGICLSGLRILTGNNGPGSAGGAAVSGRWADPLARAVPEWRADPLVRPIKAVNDWLTRVPPPGLGGRSAEAAG